MPAIERLRGSSWLLSVHAWPSLSIVWLRIASAWASRLNVSFKDRTYLEAKLCQQGCKKARLSSELPDSSMSICKDAGPPVESLVMDPT